MSKYTTEVRFICESLSSLRESDGYNRIENIIATARPLIFDFEYPIFDAVYKPVLETKILKHFYTREIGAETVGLWKLWLNRRMNEIMPYFNKRYESELLQINPLNDTNITVTRDTTGSKNKSDNTETSNTRTGSGSTEGETVSAGTNNVTTGKNEWDLYSDTPQGGINGLQDETYLTNARHNTANDTDTSTTSSQGVTNGNYSDSIIDSGESNTTGTEATTDHYVETIIGKRGAENYSKLLTDFRNTFLNIDMEVIHSLDDLFMNLW